MLQRLIAADQIASRHVPVAVVQLYLATITLWFGSDECNDANVMDAFWAVWPVFIVAAWLGGLYTSWYGRAGGPHTFSERVGYSLLESLQSPLYFIAFSFARAKPFKCIPGHGDSIAYTVAPAMLLAVYGGSIIHYYMVVRGLEADTVAKFTRMDMAATESVIVEDGNEEVVKNGTLAHAMMLGRATTALVRRKVPLTMIILHYIVVSLAIGGDACSDGHAGWFIGYWTSLTLVVAAVRFALSWRVRTHFSAAEHAAWCASEALQSALFLAVFVLLRGKPVKCFAGAGLALAYAAAVPLLVLVNIFALAASYLWLRSYTADQLVAMAVFPGNASKRL